MTSPTARGALVKVDAGTVSLEGEVAIPAGAIGTALFAHGSGSGRHSPRNQFVAQVLRQSGVGTLLIDLLTGDEEQEDLRTGRLRFDIGLLAERVVGAVDWLGGYPDTRDLAIGLFGASTGAAAALVAAAERPRAIGAVVSRGGRPDLAGDRLPHVEAATLLIVGGRDLPVIPLNEEALARLVCIKEMVIVPGATHLFEEPGSLEEVARLAAGWFARHLGVATASPPQSP
jgi:putative phosphoribosyl transferase